jgi:hypothetical protein
MIFNYCPKYIEILLFCLPARVGACQLQEFHVYTVDVSPLPFNVLTLFFPEDWPVWAPSMRCPTLWLQVSFTIGSPGHRVEDGRDCRIGELLLKLFPR